MTDSVALIEKAGNFRSELLAEAEGHMDAQRDVAAGVLLVLERRVYWAINAFALALPPAGPVPVELEPSVVLTPSPRPEGAAKCRHVWALFTDPKGEQFTACTLCQIPKSARGRKAKAPADSAAQQPVGPIGNTASSAGGVSVVGAVGGIPLAGPVAP